MAYLGSYLGVVKQVGFVSSGGYLLIFWQFQNPPDLLFSVIKGMTMATVIVLVGVLLRLQRQRRPRRRGHGDGQVDGAQPRVRDADRDARDAGVLGRQSARADRRLAPSATLTAMSKTLVIAEKPSVGQDLARVLPGPFKKSEGWLEGPEHVITWAVGHLVQLAEPDEYDAKFKRWRMADLPIVPERFKLVVRDERSRKQMSVVTKQLGREDIADVVNACDAGREGELIFAYLYEKAKGKKPVKRLWLNSMTSAAMKGALRGAAPGRGVRAARAGGALALGGRLDRRHERHARGDDPPAQLLRRRGLAGPRADADAGDHRAARGGDQGVRARALLARRCDVRAGRSTATTAAHLSGPLPRAAPAAGAQGRASPASEARGDRRGLRRAGRARSPSSRRKSSARKRRCSTT